MCVVNIFFHGEKKDPKSVSIAIFGALTKEDINIICQCGCNIVSYDFFMSVVSSVHFVLLGTQ